MIFNFVFTLVLIEIKCGHIFSNDPSTVYDWDGTPSSIIIPYKTENDCYKPCVLEISVPFNLPDVTLNI
jgi:hypothetical protein